MNWTRCLLGDVVNLKRGYDLPERDRVRGAYPVVSSSGITGSHNVAMANGPGVVTGRYGTLGQVFYVRSDFWPLNTSLYVQDFKGNHPRFVYYLLQTLSFGRRSGAAAVPGVNRNALHMLQVQIPDSGVQQKIATILSAYDDLIENNLWRIKILEEMAQSLYREWFCNFRYPGRGTTSLVSSPLGRIPLGWSVARLSQVTNKIGSGATPRGGKEAYKTEGIHLIRSLNVYDYHFDIADLASIDASQASELDHVTVVEHDILLNITGASVARCTMVPSWVLPARVNQHVSIIRVDPARASPFYVLDAINSSQRKQQLLALAQGGATREALTKGTLEKFEILLPPPPLVEQYGVIAGGIHKQREVLQHRNDNLRHTRDLLLPKLISGEVDVSELDVDIGGLEQ